MKWDEGVEVKEDIQWRNIDLNLLVTFSYLYRHRSVSKQNASDQKTHRASVHAIIVHDKWRYRGNIEKH